MTVLHVAKFHLKVAVSSKIVQKRYIFGVLTHPVCICVQQGFSVDLINSDTNSN